MQNKLTKALLDDGIFTAADKFQLLGEINALDDEAGLRNAAILVAMRLKSDEWGVYSEIASSIIRKSGLFLYLNDQLSSAKDNLSKEFHRSPSGRDFFMHRTQYAVLNKLLAGQSIILSAPTSFGKSFVIDELIMSDKYDNILIVVPTIALIDELRKRIISLDINRKIICFTGQEPGEKNIYILTQERALEMQGKIQSLDLLVIDEFYKMDSSLGNDESDRAGLLNVCYRIYESIAKQVYLLGPYINQVSGYVNTRHEAEVIVCNDNTTYIEYVALGAVSGRDEATIKVIDDEQDNILIYCNSPAEIAKLFKKIADSQYNYEAEKMNLDFADWIDRNVCKSWYVTEALKLGIGIHHARMPRFVAQEMIKRFNRGDIKILLCTSTIIEGVNTAAKTVIVYSQKRGKHKIDAFTFRNIAGRAGRTFRHFSGRVYYFGDLQSTEDIVVTDHIGDDNDGVGAGILSLLTESQLTTKQAQKLEDHHSSIRLPHEVLKENYFIDVNNQQLVYDKLVQGAYGSINNISSAHPNKPEMTMIFNALADLGLDFRSIGRGKTMSTGITRTIIFINSFYAEGIEGIAKALTEQGQLSDETIEFGFEFVRNQMSFKLPRYINALDRLQKLAYANNGNLEPFASTLEFLNSPVVYMQLDELGIPVSLCKKLNLPTDELEQAISFLKSRADTSKLTNFEAKIIEDFNS